jgi:hypothetical protein
MHPSRELADEMVDAYVDWREEGAAVWHAYERWTCAPPAEALFAFAAYEAALDREERAADVYAGLVMQVAAAAPLAIDLIPK